MAGNGCFICGKHRRLPEMPETILEDQGFVLCHMPLPERESSVYLGHLLIEPKRHIRGLEELNDQEARQVGLFQARLAQALKVSEGAEHVYSFVIGHQVPHLHIHVIPRYPGTPKKYWGVRVNEWPEAPRGGPREVETVCGRVREFLLRESTG